MRLLLLVCCLSLGLGACGQTGSSSGSSGSGVVARVGGADITQHELDVRYQASLRALAGGGAPTQNAAMEGRLRATVVRGLVLDAVIAKEAAYQHVSPSAADLGAEFQRARVDAGGTAPLETQLAAAGGSDESLRDEIKARLTEQRLEDFEAKARATIVLAQINAGASLDSLAAQWSDATETKDKGGLVGTLNDDQVKTQLGSAALTALGTLHPGEHSTTPIRTSAGYEILQLDATTAGGRTVRDILIAAPDPYSVRERPAWFAQQVFQAVLDDCQKKQITVLIGDAGANPCTGASPSGSPPVTAPATP